MNLFSDSKPTISLVLFIGIVLLSNNTIAQYPKSLYKKIVNIDTIKTIVKKQFIDEVVHSTKYDSILNFTGIDPTLKKINFSNNNISFSLLDFEQDLSEKNSFTDFYTFLVSVFYSETGHAVKIVSANNYVLSVVVQELYKPSELKSYQGIHGRFNFYDDVVPWRNFKSYKRTVQLGKMASLAIPPIED